MSTETLNMVKGEKLDLTKTNPGLKVLMLGLGWDVNSGNSGSYDLDVFAIALDANGKTKLMSDVLYFNSPRNAQNQLSILGDALTHTGDNLTGQGDGDDESIKVDLTRVPAGVEKIKFFVNIFSAQARSQRFGQVQNAFIRAYDGETAQEFGRYDLSEDYSSFTGVEMGELYRHNGEWKFTAIGNGTNGEIDQIAAAYC